MADWVTIGHKNAIENGKCIIEDLDGIQVAIFNIDGKFFAVEDMCTHDGIEFCENAMVEGQSITCPWHGAKFSIENGDVQAPPAYEPLTTFPLQILDDGSIQVKDDRWD